MADYRRNVQSVPTARVLYANFWDSLYYTRLPVAAIVYRNSGGFLVLFMVNGIQYKANYSR